MTHSNMSLFLFFFASCLYLTTKCNYFAGLALNQTVVNNANIAINNLNNTLKNTFDCQDTNRNRNLFSEAFQMKKKNTLKFNKDKTPFMYRNPSFKFGRCEQRNGCYITKLYNSVKTAAGYLQQIKKELIQYNNVILGSQNKITGYQNVVIGSKNSLTGNNDWVFGSNIEVNTIEDGGVLIIGNYLIQLADIQEILTNPSEAIRCIETKQSNSRFSSWWKKSKRRTCF